jgi:hypothetical protein
MIIRPEIAESIAATRAALNRLTPAQLEDVRDQTRRELEAFVRDVWLPEARAARAAERRAA